MNPAGSLRIMALLLVLSAAREARAEDPKPEEAPKPTSVTPVSDAPSGEANPAEGAGDEGLVRGLSWNLMAGGVPSSGALIEGSLGFSALPRIAYHHTLAPDMSIGGMFTFDYAYWYPDAAFIATLLLQAPVRYAIYNTDTISVGVRADPGIGFTFENRFLFSLLLNVGINAGYTVENRMIVGGGLDIPMRIGLASHSFLEVPLLFGPIFEFHVTPPLALTADLKIGPGITTDGTHFSFKLLAGIAYRL